jgi:ribosomal protein S18 acetylase RimI-like enzyme
MNYRLRGYRPADAEDVNTIVLAAFSPYRSAFSDWPAFSAGLGQLVQLAHESEVIVAEAQGSIVGAVGYVGPGKPKRPFYPPEWPIVRMLVVEPGHQGMGIGRALTSECIQRARRDGAPVIALHTSPLMNIALPMYERMGFQLERELPAIFGVPYGLYVKRLEEETPNKSLEPTR